MRASANSPASISSSTARRICTPSATPSATSTSVRINACHNWIRNRNDLIMDDVPLAPPRLDQRGPELFADVRDMDIDQVR
jgi:hypothetical protein